MIHTRPLHFRRRAQIPSMYVTGYEVEVHVLS